MKFLTDLRSALLYSKTGWFLGLILALATGPLFGNIDNNCELYNVIIDKGDCTSDSTYMLTFNFSYQDPGGDTFKLWVNGDYYGNFAYADLPVTIQHFPKSGGNHDWIKVCDLVTPECCRIKEFDTVECGGDCSISDILLDLGDCTSDSTYVLFFNLVYMNNGGPLFTVYANGQPFGEYAYADLPITINDFPQSGNNHDWIKVCDNEAHDCCKIKEFESPNCGGGNGDCDITELHVEAFCDGEELFYVHLDFEVLNPFSDQFKVYGNGMFHGNFNYNDLPITIGPLEADCHTHWEFIVQDLHLPDCYAAVGLGKQCCDSSECHINELVVDIGDCNPDGTYELYVNFNHQGQSDSFIVYANGAYFGKYPYQLPLVIPNFPVSGNNHDWIKICDGEHHDCCAIKEFESPECEGGPGGCQLKELEIHKECEGENHFYITFDFIPINPGNNGFEIKGNGINYGSWSYNDLPVTLGPLPADCHTFYEFVIQDKQFHDCKKVVEYGKVCCGEEEECYIKELDIDPGFCVNDHHYPLTINFNVPENYEAPFEVWINGHYYGEHPLSSLPLTLPEVLGSNNAKEKIIICLTGEPSCCHDAYYTKPACVKDLPSQFVVNNPEKEKEENHPNSFTGDGPFLLHLRVNGNNYTMTVADFPAKDRQIRIMDIMGNIWLDQNLTDNIAEETITLPYFPSNRLVIIQVLSPEKQVISRFLGKME